MTDAVVLGASAGGIEALSELLPGLPPDYRLPLMVVVHLPPDGRSLLPELFGRKCRLEVREASDKEPIRGGTVYFAPSDHHLLVERDRRLSLSRDPQVNWSRPSIDVLFETAADAYGPGLLAVVLSGGNSDGARGLRAVIDAGGTGLVQRPEQAHAAAMPTAALEACPAAQALGLSAIAARLIEAGAP